MNAVFANFISCSRLKLWVGYFMYFKVAPVIFYLMFLSSVKGINRLINKGMSNNYLNVIIEKN